MRTSRLLKRSLTSGLVILSAALCPHLASAQSAATVHIEQPAQDLSSALTRFGRETGTEIEFSPDAVRNKSAPALKGDYSPRQALELLLKGSGLVARTTQQGAVVVEPDVAKARNAASSSSPDAKEASAASGPPIAPSGADKRQDTSSASTKYQNTSNLEEVVVTGSRLAETAKNQSQPVRSYTREDIRQSGRTTIADFLNTLPDASIPSVEGVLQTFDGETTVQLHGLPVGTTLVLLNGRRVQSTLSGSFDLSNIPASAVERIEVLPVGSSAIYGGDSLAGAVNLILRNNLNGAEANARWGHAAGAIEGNFDFALGRSAERASVSFLANYQYRNELLGTGRAVGTRTDFPADAVGPLVDNCNPGNIYSLDGQPLPGLGSATQAAIPPGLTGTPSVQNFLATAGTVNRCNLIGKNVLIPPTRRAAAMLAAHYELSQSLGLFTETLFSHEHQNNRLDDLLDLCCGSFGVFTVGAGNPYNPFGVPLALSYTSPAAGASTYDHTQSFIRPLIGIRGAVFSGWSYEATAFFEKDRSRVDNQAFSDTTAIQAALDSADPATALNPFTSGAPGAPQLLQSLAAAAQTTQFRFVNQMYSVQVFLRGPLVEMSAGKLQTVIGGEYGDQKQDFAIPPTSLRRKTYALFTEAKMPLISSTRRADQGELLALNLAARFDHSNDFGGKTTWQSGLTWRPTDALLLNAGYGTSYQAPQLVQIQRQTETFPVQVVDPFRGNETIIVDSKFGANPNLQPETGHTQSVGVVYTSQVLKGFEASVAYFDLAIRKYIGTPAISVLISNPSLFPGAVVRAAPSAQDLQQGFLGPITLINSLYYNYGDLNVGGVDLDLRYKVQTSWGEWSPTIAVSNIYKWESALVPGAPTIDYVSQATQFGPGYSPRWKGTAALGWKRGAFAGSVTGRYLGRYKDYQEFVPNTNELGNFWVYDATFRIELGKTLARETGWWSTTSLELGGINLFGRSIPFSYYSAGFDPAQSDVRGRFLYAQLGVKW